MRLVLWLFDCMYTRSGYVVNEASHSAGEVIAQHDDSAKSVVYRTYWLVITPYLQYPLLCQTQH